MVEFVLKYGISHLCKYITRKKLVIHKVSQFFFFFIAAFSSIDILLPAFSINVIVSLAIKCLSTTLDDSFHPPIYDLTINLSNNRLMGRMVKPAGFKQCGPSPESLLAQQLDKWRYWPCRKEHASSAEIQLRVTTIFFSSDNNHYSYLLPGFSQATSSLQRLWIVVIRWKTPHIHFSSFELAT